MTQAWAIVEEMKPKSGEPRQKQREAPAKGIK
jgi:hypothetical protein